MIDRVSEERRSYIMSSVSSKDTAPELVVRKLLHSLGYRYRLHNRGLPGSPDLIFKSVRKQFLYMDAFGMVITVNMEDYRKAKMNTGGQG